MKFIIVFLSVIGFVYKGIADVANPIGLVLSGGGAKGAYHVGVWKALCEMGIDEKITVISGTSVGAIVASVFASVHDPYRCEDLWRRISQCAFTANLISIAKEFDKSIAQANASMDGVMSKRSEKVKAFEFVHNRKPGMNELAKIDADLEKECRIELGQYMCGELARRFLDATEGNATSVGVCDSQLLRGELCKALPSRWISAAPQVYATALEKSTGKLKAFALKGISREDVVERILASAAIPGVFDSVTIDGVAYIDGGFEPRGGDNLPIYPILHSSHKVKTIIIVSLGGRKELPEELTIHNKIKYVWITPSEGINGYFGSLSGIFDISEEKTTRLLDLGYKDAKCALANQTFRVQPTPICK